ncbi:MAG: hypothetical protein IT379_04320 [Deltaproteobacteria bacterium]|nr:hypothetical protein [Deltaproteobacteria bacterium]
MSPTLEFAPPGPGSWTFDRSHQTLPWPRLGRAELERGYAEGFRKGFREIGALLETIELRTVHGWFYTAPRPVGAPPDASGPPPKLIFKALLFFHPELRRRVRRSAAVFDERPWRTANEAWDRVHAPGFRGRLAELTRQEPSDERSLAAELRRCMTCLLELWELHFAMAAQTVPPVGDFLVAAQSWAGVEPRQALRALGGASPETVRPLALLRAIAAALREASIELPEAPAAALDVMRAHPVVAAALATYLDEYGWRIDNLVAEAIAEHPAAIVAGVRAALDAPRRVDPAADAAAAAADLRARVPAEHRDDFDRRLAEARDGGRTREDQVGLATWAGGLVRRHALELGRRLAARGRLAERDAVFDLDCDEIDAVVAGAGPARDVVEGRSAERRAATTATPPRTLGRPASPPPIEWLPPGAARLTRAVMAFVSRFEEDVDEPAPEPLVGLGVAPGVVEGIACVVRTPADLDRVEPDSIMVATATNVGFNAVLSAVAGLVTEHGGLVCHAAIVSRELGIPGVVGCRDAMSRVPDGAWVRVDGDRGRVEVLAPPEAAKQRPARARPLAEPTRQARRPAALGSSASLGEAADAATFGGKAAGLARAIANGLPVPRGFALDPDFVEAVAAEDPAHLERLAALVDGLAGPLVVRSSALGEDGIASSFAGIHHSALGVRGAEVAGALAAVWRSGWTDAALVYRRRHGLSGEPRMAAVVQELVAAEVAGVAFGRDPLSGDATRVIEASWGLGAVVVDGRVTPDRVRVDASGAVVERASGRKTVMDVVDGSGAKEVAVPSDRVERSCLEPPLLDAVIALGVACDRLAGSPQDIEWAHASDRVWLLQMRPITTAVKA